MDALDEVMDTSGLTGEEAHRGLGRVDVEAASWAICEADLVLTLLPHPNVTLHS